MRSWQGITLVAGLALIVRTTPVAGQAVDTAGAIQAATAAAEGWLRVVDQKDYAASWDSAASAFKGAVAREKWEQAAGQARGALGQLGAREKPAAQYATQLPNVPAGQYVVLQYRTAAGPGRTVVETVTTMLDGGRGWRVLGYFVRPQ
jgi:hypothetical protein